MASDTSDTGSIERDLDQTRSRLGSHLNELQGRLSPGQVIDDMMTYFRGSEGADFGRNLMESVRSNPLPAALTGIGLAWLMASNPRPGAAGGTSTLPHADHDFDARLRTAERRVARQPDEPEHVYATRLTEARGQAIGVAREPDEPHESFADRVNHALAKARQTAADSMQAVRDGAGNMAGSVSGALGSAGGAAQTTVQQAGGVVSRGGQAASQLGGNVASTLTDSPVLLGALGLAAGALLGSLLPQSDTEEDLLGGVAGQARDTVRSLAGTAMERGGNVAQAVMEAGQDSAQQHGLTEAKSPGTIVDSALGGDLASNAKQVAQDVLRTADQAVHKEALGERK